MRGIETASPPLTLDALLRLGDVRVEIINGEVQEMSAAGILHHFIISNIVFALQPYVRQHDLGAVFSDGLTYLMHEDHQRLRASFVPDASFIRKENFPVGWDISRPHPGVPDLAVEVVSPGDDADQLETKIRTYLAKGTEQVWVAYPTSQAVHQYINGSTAQTETALIYTQGIQQVNTEGMFPGLVLTLDDIFKLPPRTVK